MPAAKFFICVDLAAMKISIFAMEIPYPPIHGGRVDIWRRVKALHQAGVKIQLVGWSHTLPSSDELAVIANYTEDFYPILYKRTPSSLALRAYDLLSYPLEVTSRILRGKDREDLLSAVKQFAPDIIFADHIHTGVMAKQISEALNVPFVVRSHDIEHLHYQYWLQSSTGLKKLVRLLSLNHLEEYEETILKQALAFYDISIDDLQFWKDRGLTNGHWLPPLIELSDNSQSSGTSTGKDSKASYDAVFLGNLVADNNVAGVSWFIKQVLPILRSKKPDVKVLIAGSNPTSEVINLCEKFDDVVLIANPPSTAEIHAMGRVLINPVAVGSGVSIKSIDMLAIGKPIVTLPKGLSGLPEEAKKFFRVASDEESFAEGILRCLTDHEIEPPNYRLLTALFGQVAVENFVTNLEQKLAKRAV